MTNPMPFETAVDLLSHSNSPVANLLADFLKDVLTVGDLYKLVNCRVTSLERMYKEAFSTSRLLAEGPQSIGKVRVIPTTDDVYYLIYYPSDAEAPFVAATYQGFEVRDPERFKPDVRSIVLKIDLKDEDVVAKPIVIIQDNEEPMTGGLISYQLFSSAYPNIVVRMVDHIKVALRGRSFRINDKTFVRPSLVEEPPTF